MPTEKQLVLEAIALVSGEGRKNVRTQLHRTFYGFAKELQKAVGDGSTVCPMNNSQNNMVGFWERPRAQSSRTERWHLVSILQLQAVQGEITAADEHVRDMEVDEVKCIAAIPSYPMPFVHDACSEWLARQEAQPLQEST